MLWFFWLHHFLGAREVIIVFFLEYSKTRKTSSEISWPLKIVTQSLTHSADWGFNLELKTVKFPAFKEESDYDSAENASL